MFLLLLVVMFHGWLTTLPGAIGQDLRIRRASSPHPENGCSPSYEALFRVPHRADGHSTFFGRLRSRGILDNLGNRAKRMSDWAETWLGAPLGGSAPLAQVSGLEYLRNGSADLVEIRCEGPSRQDERFGVRTKSLAGCLARVIWDPRERHQVAARF